MSHRLFSELADYLGAEGEVILKMRTERGGSSTSAMSQQWPSPVLCGT